MEIKRIKVTCLKLYTYFGKTNIIGDKVKETRRKLGMTQCELAAKLQIKSINIEQKAISRIENGERIVTDFELLELSRVLNVSVEWLLAGE